jgi:acetoin utilization deacetylase AcuC-like enzyme
MLMSASGYARLTQALCGVSDRRAEGRLVLVTEGGYDLDALAACLELTVAVAAGEAVSPAADESPTRRAAAAVSAVRAAQARNWRL